MSLSLKLREQTATAHQALETELDMLSPAFDVARYRETIKGFHAYMHALLPLIKEFLPGVFDVLAINRHLQRLDRDLTALQLQPRVAATANDLPLINSAAQAWGALYVVEGSMLGNRILGPHFKQHFAIDSDSGCAYFCGDVDASKDDHHKGMRWPEFRNLLDVKVIVEAEPETITAAAQTFETLRLWLHA
ncbi:MAG: heme oxygenase [Verrucomicrobiaceae bacterium]|nr:heme oxygenase [Verrucomicrobiaceae bacterium]